MARTSKTRSEQWADSLAILVMGRPLATLLTTLSVLGLLIAGLSRAHVNNDGRQFFVSDDPMVDAQVAFEEAFGSDQRMIIVLENATGPFDEQLVKGAFQLQHELAAILYEGKPALKDIFSPFSIPFVSELDGSVDFSPLADATGHLRFDAKSSFQKVREHPIYGKSLTNNDGRIAVLTCTYAQDPSRHHYTRTVNRAVQELVQAPQYASLNAQVVGSAVFGAALDKVTSEETVIFGLSSLGVCVLALALLFRRFAYVLGPILSLILSTLMTVGIMGWLGNTLNVLHALLPTSIIITGLGHSVHIINAYLGAPEGMTPKDALYYGWKTTLLPSFITALTTAAGFLSMMLAPIVPMRSLGLFVAFGVFSCFALSYILVPTLILLLKPSYVPRRESRESNESSFFSRLSLLITSRAAVVSISLFALALTMMAGLPMLTRDASFLHALRKSHPFRQSVEFVDNTLGGSSAFEVVVRAPKGRSFREPELLRNLYRVGTRLVQRHEGVHSAISPADIFIELGRAFAKPSSLDQFGLPKSIDASEGLLLMLESADSDVMNSFMVEEDQLARLSFRTSYLSGDEVEALIDSIRTALVKHFDHIQSDIAWTASPPQPGTNTPQKAFGVPFAYTGNTALASRVNKAIISAQVDSFILAVIVVTMLLMIVLQSFRLGLLVMVPNLFPIFATYGLMGWFGLPVDFMTSTVAVGAIGVAVDGTIHIGTKFRRLGAKGHSPQEAAVRVMTSVGKAIFVTSIVLAAGFATAFPSMMISVAMFGVIMALSLLLAMVYDIIMTPAMLAWLGKT